MTYEDRRAKDARKRQERIRRSTRQLARQDKGEVR